MEVLKYLHADFEQIADILERIASEILDNQISRYPVFIVSQGAVNIGLSIATPTTSGTTFNYRVSFLEELVSKNIIQKDKIVDFKFAYKDTLKKACLLFVTGNDYQFIFLPYDLSDSESE